MIFTFAGAGKSVGAIYIPTAEMVPEVAFPPKMPFTLQVRRGVAGSRHCGSQLQSFPQQHISAWRRDRYGYGWRRWWGRTRACASPATARIDCEGSHQSEQQALSLRPSLKRSAVPLWPLPRKC